VWATAAVNLTGMGDVAYVAVQELAGLPPEAADQISLADVGKIIEAVMDFFGISLPTGPMERDPSLHLQVGPG
jgi:hypothetical protein